jgi:hypothetical protein
MIWIGIDAHKRVHQAVALSVDGVLGQRVIANTTAGWIELIQWAASWLNGCGRWKVPGRSDAGWRSSSPAAASRCTRSTRVGPLSVVAGYVDRTRAMLSMPKRLCHSRRRVWRRSRSS